MGFDGKRRRRRKEKPWGRKGVAGRGRGGADGEDDLLRASPGLAEVATWSLARLRGKEENNKKKKLKKKKKRRTRGRR